MTTTSITELSQTTAKSGGDITNDGGSPVIQRGVCWSQSPNPKISDSKITDPGSGLGEFTCILSGLNSDTYYYARSFATNSLGTIYGPTKTFTTLTFPVVTTTPAGSITASSAASGGTVTKSGNTSIMACGVWWSASPNAQTTGTQIPDPSVASVYTSNLTGLVSNTLYYYKAYATNSVGTSYGEELTFATIVGSVTTTAVSSVGSATATAGGTVAGTGNAVLSAGVCWSTNANPTIADSKTSNATAPGTYSSSLTGLLSNTQYYIRAFATNAGGTVYGSEVSFITLPEVITSNPSSITNTAMVIGGQVSTSGSALTVTARGVCWGTNQSPTIVDSKTSEGSGPGAFSSNLSIGLASNTQYYLRAYATTSAGTTTYGN